MSQLVRLSSLRLSACLSACALVVVGCGTTRSTDTMRTATEQLLVSDAVDRAIQSVNFGPLTGQNVYLDDSKLADVVDKNYIVSTLRQHMLASGCILKDAKDQADFIVEARAGAVGTDRNDLLFGIPATNVPQILPLQGVPAAIPEVPLAKRRDQRGIAKISMFAYQRQTGLPVWQSGLAIQESSSNDVWLFGAGPFQHGTIYQGPAIAGQADAKIRAVDPSQTTKRPVVGLSDEATFASPDHLVKQLHRLPAATAIAGAPSNSHQSAAAPTTVASLTTPTMQTAPATTPTKTVAATNSSDASGQSDQQIPSVMVQAKKADPPKPITRPADTQSARNLPAKASESSLPQPRFDSL
ncbi:MAG TPA: DUF6655 family protein [Lacipirellulaceae bacterium]|jgi:hypothetical protein